MFHIIYQALVVPPSCVDALRHQPLWAYDDAPVARLREHPASSTCKPQLTFFSQLQSLLHRLELWALQQPPTLWRFATLLLVSAMLVRYWIVDESIYTMLSR